MTANQPPDTSRLSDKERFDILRLAHRYLCNVQTGGILSDPAEQAALFERFYPTFHALVLDGATLELPPT